jgi:hypothetical protein
MKIYVKTDFKELRLNNYACNGLNEDLITCKYSVLAALPNWGGNNSVCVSEPAKPTQLTRSLDCDAICVWPDVTIVTLPAARCAKFNIQVAKSQKSNSKFHACVFIT